MGDGRRVTGDGSAKFLAALGGDVQLWSGGGKEGVRRRRKGGEEKERPEEKERILPL